jgi:plasmid stabilization system protein ParE
VRIRFTPQANRYLAAIADYLIAHNPQAASRVRDAIIASTRLVASFPESGREQRTQGIRKVIVSRYRYIRLLSD